jgi:hypothetical protein
METSGERVHLREKSEENQGLAVSLGLGENIPQTLLWPRAKSPREKNTHRLSAWGVLGATTDGLPFLLTHPVAFRSICLVKTHVGKKVSRRSIKFCNALTSCNGITYSGIAGGRAAINAVNRASLRTPANSGSLYTASIPL